MDQELDITITLNQEEVADACREYVKKRLEGEQPASEDVDTADVYFNITTRYTHQMDQYGTDELSHAKIRIRKGKSQ